MRARIAIATVLCVVIVLLPVITNVLENYVISTPGQYTQPSTTTFIAGGGEVRFTGCSESHEGADTLIVCPSKIFSSKAGIVVRVNITVKFKHAQPCPYSNWKISVGTPSNAEIVNESKTELVDPYTAVKYFYIRIQGNGTVTVVYNYGSGCPYGTEERVTVEYYVVENISSVTLEQSTSLTESTTSAYKVFEGTPNVNLESKSLQINGTSIEVRGSWVCNGKELKWRDVLTELSQLPPTTKVVVEAVYEEGAWKATKIEFNNTTCVRGEG